MYSWIVFILVFAIIFIESSCNIVIKPTKTTGVQAAYVFVQGASIPAINYKKYAQQLQDKFNGSLWVGLTEFPFDLPEPVAVNSVMSSLFQEFKTQGFNYDQNTYFFFCGHSLGGIVVQNYIFGLNKDQLPFKYGGLILEGSFVTRGNTDKSQNYGPILTIGAELDGLARITRLAESFYRNFNATKNNLLLNTSTTHIVPGMNHYQFSGEGNPPPTVVKNDITPEINNTQARDLVTNLLIIFMKFQLNQYTNEDIQYYAVSLQQTADLASPIIDAFEVEGFYHFKPPCSSSPSLKPPACYLGSPWSKLAQQMMGNLSIIYLNTTDNFNNVVSIPEHFPSLSTNCPASNCVVTVTTVTENSYSLLDPLDNGLEPVAALEAKTKMKSRQSILQAFSGKPFNFNKTDEINICAQINQASLNWALKKIPNNTLNRYLSRGKILSPIDDSPVSTGFSWVNTKLIFKETVDPKTNKTLVQLGSPTLRTSTSTPFVPGYHYCKLLTTARAVEWMYVDSVKP